MKIKSSELLQKKYKKVYSNLMLLSLSDQDKWVRQHYSKPY